MEKIILFQGDSITDSNRDRNNDNYSGSGYATMVKGQLGAQFPGKYRFYNRGINGNRIVDVYARIKADIINLRPDYMSLLIGVNEIWHEIDYHNGIDAEKFEILYCTLIDEIRAALPDIKLMLLEPFILRGFASDHEDDPQRFETFQREVPLRAAVVRRVAEKYGIPFVALQERFDAACMSAPPSYWLFDGVHPSAMGHDLIKQAWLEAFEKLN